jgi:hypothetical protein
VVVCEGLVDVCDIQVVPFCHSLRGESTLFDTCVYVSDGDPAAFDMRLVVDFRVFAGDDPIPLRGHRLDLVA